MNPAMWAVLRKLAPYLAIVGLLFFVLIQRNNIADKTAKIEAADVRIKSLDDANKFNAHTIEVMGKMVADNDAIATAVAAKLQGTQVREVNTRTIIEKAVHDEPEVRAWGDSPVPDSVRRALRSR